MPIIFHFKNVLTNPYKSAERLSILYFAYTILLLLLMFKNKLHFYMYS